MKSKKNNKIIVLIIVLLVALVVGVYVYKSARPGEDNRVVNIANKYSYMQFECASACPLTGSINGSGRFIDPNCTKNCVETTQRRVPEIATITKGTVDVTDSRLITNSAEILACKAVMEKNKGWNQEVSDCIKSALPILRNKYHITLN
jgi:hypothetical protein